MMTIPTLNYQPQELCVRVHNTQRYICEVTAIFPAVAMMLQTSNEPEKFPVGLIKTISSFVSLKI